MEEETGLTLYFKQCNPLKKTLMASNKKSPKTQIIHEKTVECVLYDWIN